MPFERIETLKDSDKSKVYLVYDQTRRQMLVEKHLSGEVEVYRRLKDMNHPFLPELFDVQFTDRETIVWEEYVAGKSLAQTAATEKQLRCWLLELCSVLSFLHRHKILHRDIKPSNLLVGDDGHVRLIDFDAARVEKTAAESDTRLLGTRGYAPPEQYGFAQTDERADIYALGVTFRELLGPLARKHRWKCILCRCTALEPKRRYKHVGQIKLAIRFGQLQRYVLYPICILFLFALIGFTAWSYHTDSEVKTAMDIILTSKRDLIFEGIDVNILKHSAGNSSHYYGEKTEIYHRLKQACPDGNFISTGYADEEGHLLFGSFSMYYDISTGERWYSSFNGLCYIDEGLEVHYITDDQLTAYGSAVLALYELDIFDTPLL